jgi:RsiW-degrading membrane proteinase PrsW (M82 family)
MQKLFSIILLGAAMLMTAPCVTTVSAQQPSAQERIEAAKAQQQATFKAQQAQNDSLKAVREAQQAAYDAQNAKYQRNLWLVIGLFVIGACIGLFFRYKSLIISIIQIFTGGFRTKGDITTIESKKILVGAIYASQQGAYLNTLKADIGAKLH